MIDLAALVETTGGAVHGPVFARRFSSFSYDSRLLPQPPGPEEGTDAGPLFVAVRTEKGDGHDFIADAVSRGATGVLCQHPVELHDQAVTCVVVPDTRVALLAYARQAFQRPQLDTVGVTGSTGKTTAKELIAAVLARGARPVFRNRGSINGRYGLSIAAGELEPRHRLAVLELAADSFDEILDLADLTRPQLGVLTTISNAHLATFGSVEAIAEEKGRLLEALPSTGLAVLNADDPWIMRMADRTKAQVLTVGQSESADLRATDIQATAQGLSFQAASGAATERSPRDTYRSSLNDTIRKRLALLGDAPGSKASLDRPARVTTSLLGVHQVPLLLSALAAGLWFDIALADILAALASFQPLPGRLRPLPGRNNRLLLDDTVSASPASMRASLEVLELFQERPRLAVLGDMWDLGVEETSAHRQVGRQAAQVLDWLIVKGERAQEIANGALTAGIGRERVFRAYTDADVLRFVETLLPSAGATAPATAGRRGGPQQPEHADNLRFLASPDASIGAGEPVLTGAQPSPVILIKGDRQARMERIVAALLAAPEQASQLLVRQSAGWQQVRPLTQDRPTWVEINLEAVAGNIRRAQEIVGNDVGICAVLKADGYGHGAVSIARTALNNGARLLAVACLAEAVALRRAAIDAPILVLGYTPAWQARDTVRHDIIATVYDLDIARALSQAAADLNRTARVHVKVDTGMARLGLLPEQVLPFVQQLQQLSGVTIDGIFTHLSVADSDEQDHVAHTEAQLARFGVVLTELEEAGVRPALVHAANSAGMLRYPRSRFNLVRLGIALYGLAPSQATLLPPGFHPALNWKTQVAQVKTLPAGAAVSYGNTFVTQQETVVAVIPVGYADGFRRAPRHWEHVLVRGQRAPIIGRVTMDQTMLDVTHIAGVRQGDEVVLIGRQGDEELSVDEVAERLGTINYEVVSEILARVPRVV